jgi:hypothetical protein
MIPPFDEHGNLPPGIHPATLDEIAERFGQESEVRRDQMESLRWLVDAARRSGVERIVINGSFVTDTYEPNDVDCALLIGPKFLHDRKAVADFAGGLPFLHIDLARQDGWDEMVETVFAKDRHFRPKGMIEVVQWT